MEDIFEEEESTTASRGISLAERFRLLETKVKLQERGKETEERGKNFKFPNSWLKRFKKSTKKGMEDLMLVFFLNKKNEIEAPKFMPIFDGNMIIWKNKPYEFDPRAIWTVQGVKKNPRAYLIKEIDRRPVRNRYGRVVYRDAAVSNMDLDEIRMRGDSTESDEFLIKAALKAQKEQVKKKMNLAIAIVIGIIVVGGIIYLLTSK